MGVAPGRIIVVGAVFARGVRTGRPVVTLGIEFTDHPGQGVVEKTAVVVPRQAVGPSIAVHALFDFVVAAPEGEASVMTDAANVVDCFDPGVFHEIRIPQGIGGAGEHEVLPDAETKLIAGVEKVRFIKFLVYSAVASLLWNILIPILGYVAGSERKNIELLARGIGFLGWIFIVASLGIILLVVKKELKNAKDQRK